MKILYIIPFFFSLSIFAQEQEYKYEPVSNKAEYYIGSFNKGKDLDDLIDWYEDFADWAEDQGDTYDSMTVAILTPYFNNDLSTHDTMWVNTWPSPVEQYAGLDKWMKEGQDLLKDLPSTNSAVIDTWQWVLSEPREMKPGNMMAAVYSECYLNEGVNMRMVYDLYKDFAIFAQENGDTVGRKLIIPSSKTTSDADFHRLLYTSSVAEMGTNAALFWDKLSDSEAAQAMEGWECKNAVEYMGMAMRTPE